MATDDAVPEFQVSGVVRTADTAPDAISSARLAVEVLDVRLGGEHSLGRVPVEADGGYRLRFDPLTARATPAASLDLVVRVVGADDAVLARSATRFDAGAAEEIDVDLPGSALPRVDEYARAVAELDRGVSSAGGPSLAPAAFVQDAAAGRYDVTYAAAKSGLDPRIVAMVSLAQREEEATAIPAPLHYALYRAGLPAGSRLWGLAAPEVIGGVWSRAVADGTVSPDLAEQLPAHLETARTLAGQAVLDLPTGVAGGKLSDLLADALPQDTDRARFARLYSEHRERPDRLWARTRDELGEEVTARLQLTGALAALTRNNAELISRVQAEAAPRSVGDLASAGYYRPEAWRRLLTDDVPIPDDLPLPAGTARGDAVPGPGAVGGASAAVDGDEAGRDAYAVLLAEELRLRYPTAVIGAEVADGSIPLDGPRGTDQGVASFLAEHHERFELTVQPVAGFLGSNALEVEPPVREGIAALQRVVAVAAGPEAVRGLRRNGFGSARSVVALGERAFVTRFGGELGGEEAARETFRRSDQVHTAVLATATSHLLGRSAPPVYAIPAGGPSSGAGAGATALAGIATLPTLETLFGSTETVGCEDCESVLSPGAYLVDLLEFLDVDPAAPGERRPLDVLLDRRPDLQHIALSCENTETELPYVDIVNEILEHVVIHRSISGYEGHDVSPETSSAELLASPQYVDEAAYTDLRTARFPLVLPWDQRLAGLRAYLGQVDVKLHDAMATLTPDDARGRSWSDAVRERTGIAPADRDILVSAAVKAQELYGDDPARVTEDQLIAGVGNARRLARRLGLTPTELVDLVRTRFLNPDADLLPLLVGLGVSFPTIEALHTGAITPAEFRAKLAPGLDQGPYGGDVVAWLSTNHARVANILLLTDPTGAEPAPGDQTGGFERLELRRSLPGTGGNRLRPVDLVAIARLVRLRRRLGWTIERTDEVVTALWPATLPPGASSADLRKNLDAGFDAVLVRLGRLLTAADLLGLDVDAELPRLLALVAPLGVRGPDSPFRTLFPVAARPGADPAFGLGADGLPPAARQDALLDHAPALLSALTLTADELPLVAAAAGVDTTTKLSVDSVSALFRVTYLARVLQIGVAELVGLLEVTGRTPFIPPDGETPDLLALIRLVLRLREADLPVATLVALARGDTTTDDAAMVAVLRDVRATLTDPTPPSDGEWSETGIRSLLAAVLPMDATDTLLGLLAGSRVYATGYHQDAPALPDAVLQLAPALTYDAARSRLTHRGLLTAATATAIGALAGLPAGLAVAVAVLANAVQADHLPLVRSFPLVEKLTAAWTTAVPPADAGAGGDLDAFRRNALGAVLLVEAAPQLRRQQLTALLAPALGVGADVLAPLLADPTAVPGTAEGLAGDLAAVTATGMTARFWAGAATTGAPVRTATVDAVDLTSAAALHAAAGVASGAVSAVWAGLVDPAVPGTYALTLDSDAASATLTLDGDDVPLTKQGQTWTTTLDLTRPARLALTTLGIASRVRLVWAADGLAPVTLPGAQCCPIDLDAAFRTGYRRLAALVGLATAVRLSPPELLAFARAPQYRIAGVPWPAALPVTDPAARRGVVTAVDALLKYHRLRQAWGITDTSLLPVLDGTVATPPALGDVGDVVAHLGATGRTLDVDVLLALDAVLTLVRRTGLPVAALAETVRSTPAPEDVDVVRAAARTRYDDDAWHEVERPIQDGLRRAARDALVALVLQQQDADADRPDNPARDVVTTADKLYEQLLIDVGTEPVVTTSRIAQAISTVQLFVARALLNLEPDVSPEVIDPQRWEVLKRYRVWEANRRVFLFPENWLDPELRDDKSPFFRDVESELLQTDITDQAAAVALGHYLEKLDDVANLEIAGMQVEEHAPVGTVVPSPTVRVIGRTFGAKRSYYHRTLEGTWMAWEPVEVEVPDDPVLPVYWQGRFLLFWIRVAKRPDANPTGPFTGAAGQRLGDLRVGDLNLRGTANLTVSLFWSEFYNGRWQSPRTSDPDRPVNLGAQFNVVGDPDLLQLASDLQTHNGRQSLGIIVLNPTGNGNSQFRLHTTHSLPVRKDDDLGPVFGFPVDRLFSETGPLVVTVSGDALHSMKLLKASEAPYRAVGPMHRLDRPRLGPFFFQDSRHVFYVHPAAKDMTTVHPGFGDFPQPIAAPPPLPVPGFLTLEHVDRQEG